MNKHLGLYDVTLAINQVLKDNFPEVSRESDEVKEGFRLPSFFVQIVPLRFSHESEFYKRLQLLINIKFFSKTGKEIENIKMSDALGRAFGIVLPVKNRLLKLKNISSNVDKDRILSFNFDLDFITFFDRDAMEKEEYETMLEIITDLEYKNKEWFNGNDRIRNALYRHSL